MKIRFIFAAVVSFAYLSESNCSWYKRLERAVSKAEHDVEHAVSNVSYDVEGVCRNIGQEAEHVGRNIGRETEHAAQQIRDGVSDVYQELERAVREAKPRVEGEFRRAGSRLEELFRDHREEVISWIPSLSRVLFSRLTSEFVGLDMVTNVVTRSIQRLGYNGAEVSENEMNSSSLLASTLENDADSHDKNNLDAICMLMEAFIVSAKSSSSSDIGDEIKKYIDKAVKQVSMELKSEEIAEHSQNNMSSSE